MQGKSSTWPAARISSNVWPAGAALVLVWVTGISAARAQQDWTAICAVLLATLPVIDLAVRTWRGTLTAAELERICPLLLVVWIALFLALGALWLA